MRRALLPVLPLALLALAPLPAPTQEAPPLPSPAAPEAAPDVREAVSAFTLDNGLEVVVIEDARAPVVVHMMWYKVGSADEPPGLSGIAHYLEHLMFKGTEALESGEFSRTVAAQGGTDNAFTSYDYTAYFQRVAADRLDLMMEMEADRMANLRVDEGEALTELTVVLEERAQRTDSDPAALFGEERRAAQYLNHRYGIPIIGWRHEIEAYTLQDAMAFYEAHYGPDNAVLVVAGDVEPQAVRAMAQARYGAIPAAGIAPRARVQEPPQRAERRLRFEDPRVAQPYVIRTYLAPQRRAGDQREAAALTLLAEVLGGSPATSVLAQALQFETQQALYTTAFYDGTSLDETTFGLAIVPAPGRSLEEAEAALDAAVAAFLEEGIDPEQLDRIKMQLRAARIYAEDDVSARARRYGQALASGLAVEDVQAWPDLLQAVEEAEILEAAQILLDRGRAVTGYLTAPATGADGPAPQPLADPLADPLAEPQPAPAAMPAPGPAPGPAPEPAPTDEEES